MMLGGNISERTNTLSLETSLRPSSSSGAAQGSDLKRPYDAGTLRLDSSEMADRLEWKDYPILFIYPP